MKKLYIILLALLVSAAGFSQNVQREFRASWLATVSNIDWPRVGVGASAQKQDLITILDKLKAMNMNAVILQIRPTADAFYNSAYEPWSEWLTGQRGTDPGYDPLQFAIEESHKRSIELHVWLNPYRFETSAGRYAGKPGDYMASHPQWILTVNSKTYFNPGIPDVTKHIKKIMGDIISKYDIDGVLFDDYFYPDGISTQDQAAYNSYNSNNMSIADFRRASVNKMIKAVNDTIKSINPAMRFGVSPAGVYTNTSAAASHGTSIAPGTSGWDVYNRIYCDALAWLEEGSVDYLSPQIYWDINDAGQWYNVLTEWWGKECKRFGKHCYPSIGAYRLASKSEARNLDINGIEQILALKNENEIKGYSLQEIVDEINVNRQNEVNNVYGSVFYSTKHITGYIDGLGEFIHQNAFQQKAVFKEMNWLNAPAPTVPSNLAITQGLHDAVPKITWTGNDPYYIVFATQSVTKTEPVMIKQVFYKSFTLENLGNYTHFAVAAMNGKGEMSALSNEVQLLAPEKPVLLTPLGETVSSTKEYSWNSANFATSYNIDFYSDEALTNKLFAKSNITDKKFAFTTTVLDGQATYYWQVTAVNAIGTNPSVVGSFTTGYPQKAQITSPTPAQIQVPVSGSFTWNAQSEATAYYVQLSRNADFTPSYIVFGNEIATNSYNYSNLLTDTDYFLRVYAKNANGNGIWSEVVHFTTINYTGINDLQSGKLRAFPIPANEHLTIELQNQQNIEQLFVYSVTGKMIQSLSMHSPSCILNLENYEKAIYQVIILSDKKEKLMFRFINE